MSGESHDRDEACRVDVPLNNASAAWAGDIECRSSMSSVMPFSRRSCSASVRVPLPSIPRDSFLPRRSWILGRSGTREKNQNGS